jgi:4-hydroxyacetophenone monooxygenase
MPLYHAWYRLRLGWAFNDKIYPALQRDSSWPHPERAVNAINDGHRRYFTRYIVEELGERQDLLDRTLPSYPPFGKRMLMDNGWFRTMTRDNVELVTEHVAEVRADRVITKSGAEYEADALIWATGFDVVHFLAGIEIVGRDGQTLARVWDGDDARAYYGATVPGFPNFFCLYGPNTQFGHGGSLITVMERQVHYLMNLLTQMLDTGTGEVEVRQDVYDRYNERIDAAHANMVWTHPGMDTYYRNSRGRVVVNNPFRIVEYWQWTERADLRDYHTAPAVTVV